MKANATDSSLVATLIAMVRASGGEIHIPKEIMEEDVTDKWELHADLNPATKEMTWRAVKTEQAETA